MKVNAINSYKFNNVHFEGKKSKQDNRIMNTTTPIKAVPVIVLMAMSPLNAPLMNAKPVVSAEPQTEISAKQDKVVASEQYFGATPSKDTRCTINYISNDGQDDSIERVQLVFDRKTDSYNKQNEIYQSSYIMDVVNMNALLKRTIKTIGSDKKITTENFYFVSGNGTKIVKVKDLNGKTLSSKIDEKNNLQVEITENFYNDLKSISDESIKIKEEVVVNDHKNKVYEKSLDDLYLMN